MQCPRCQHENRPQAKFCEECATPLKTASPDGPDATLYAEVASALTEARAQVTEAQKQQTATSEILRVISCSPTDVQPVFDVIAERAMQLCGASVCGVARFDGELLHLVALANVDPAGAAALRSVFPRPPGLGSAGARAVLTRSIVHIPDNRDDPDLEIVTQAQAAGFRGTLSVPILRAGKPIGAIAVGRPQPGPFSERQIALLETFADQAVIAIENVRLFKELETRNTELTEALARQTASGEILRVISGAHTDAQPVFDTIVHSALRLLNGHTALVLRVKEEMLYLAALTSTGDVADDAVRATFPHPASGGDLASHVVRTGRPYVVSDTETDPLVSENIRRTAPLRGYRSMVFMPMLRDRRVIGILTVTRQAPGGFSEEEAALLQTFADQALIAMENVRLFKELEARNAELTEALEQQTATGEILRVISGSPIDTQPVFDAIVMNASRLCDARDVFLVVVEDDALRAVAATGQSASLIGDYNARRVPISRDSVSGRTIVDRATMHVPDLAAAPEAEFPEGRALQRLFGHRTMLATPLLREDVAVGAIVAFRFEVRLFSERQIALLKTFADQAVIAIENVRLFKELEARNRDLTEALERQTATSEILRVISGSPTEVQPTFEAIARSARRLCDAAHGMVFRFDGELIHLVAHDNLEPDRLAAVQSVFPIRPGRESVTARAILTRSVVHISDRGEDAELGYSILSENFPANLAVPLLRDGVPLGAIVVTRAEIRPFSDAQIALLKTFADQAVIAIENVRLFKALEERNGALTEALDRQTGTSEILQVISGSPTDVQPVFAAIARSAARLCNAFDAAIFQVDGGVLRLVAHEGPVSLGPVGQFTIPLVRGSLTGRVTLERRTIQIADHQTEETEYPEGTAIARRYGVRTMLGVPLLRAGEAVGVIALRRAEVRPFTDRQVELLQTFADQAVIAIENVRLFTQLQTSNRELSAALDTQMATSDILRVISRSQTDVQPVFDAIVRSAVRLLGGHSGGLTRVVGDQRELAAFMSTDPAATAVLSATYPRPLNSPGAHGQAIRDRAPVNILDMHTDVRVTEAGCEDARVGGYRSVVAVPLLRRANEAIGALAVTRREPGGFTDDEIALLQTLADQAVIAIENARLLTELRERTHELTRSVEQLTALSEVGRAVSSSLDLETVLTTIVARAVQLTGVDGGVVFEYDEVAEEFELRASTGQEALDEVRRRARFRKGEGVVGRTAITHEPVQVADITRAGTYVGRLREGLIEAGVRALLAIPMLREGHLIGSLVVNRNTPGDFPPETVDLLRTFATQSALAIQNARLFQEVEDKGRELEAASRHKSEFLANMSHELRTPLNAIIGFSEVLLERMFGEVNEKQIEYLQDILSSGQHLLSLINDILDLSKIEAGRMELALAPFDLPQALENALILVRERAARHGIAVTRDLDPRLGELVGDERKIKQVLLNLLSNAVKFTPEGGQISLTARLQDGTIEIAVRDTGIGIAPEDQGTIFEEFRQVGGDYTRKQEGTGLGLTLTKKFVEMHGGRIWVESAVGRGSTFTFTLPVRPEERSA